MNSIRRVAPVLIVALVIALLFGGLVNAPALAQTARQQFGWILAKRLTVDTTATIGGAAAIAGATTVGGALAVTGNTSTAGLSATGDTALGGNVSLGDFTSLEYAGNLAVLDGGPLTPLRTFQQISAAGAAGMTVTTTSRGTIVTIVNMGSNAVTITDTGTTMLGSNAALGQYDTLTLISDGTNMIELARANN
jgi:hypothetical protein